MQGMARGKVGDVVFSRLDGQQISRVRNRNPRNPKTVAQLYQRAIMATVMQAYSHGKAIFDHSFEGKSVGSGCQRYFMQKNAKLLRTALANDLENQPLPNISGLFNGPGTATPVANPYLVSEGSLSQSFFQIVDASENAATAKIDTPQVASETETIAEYMSRCGLVPGDIYTFVAFCMGGDGKDAFIVNGDYGTEGYQLFGRFAFVRLKVKEPADPTQLASAAEGSDVFTIEASSNINDVDLITAGLANYDSNCTSFVSMSDDECVIESFAIIRSRDNEGTRSTEFMHWAHHDRKYGLDWKTVLAGWQQGATQVGQSDLILEGGNF